MNTPAELAIQPRTEQSELIDRAVVLDRVGGDEDLLREITIIFLEEYPILVKEIETALKSGDAKVLERSAHTLKGSVANFGAPAATQAAYRLESMGRRGQMQEAGDAFHDLVMHFQELHPALEQLAF